MPLAADEECGTLRGSFSSAGGSIRRGGRREWPPAHRPIRLLGQEHCGARHSCGSRTHTAETAPRKGFRSRSSSLLRCAQLRLLDATPKTATLSAGPLPPADAKWIGCGCVGSAEPGSSRSHRFHLFTLAEMDPRRGSRDSAGMSNAYPSAHSGSAASFSNPDRGRAEEAWVFLLFFLVVRHLIV